MNEIIKNRFQLRMKIISMLLSPLKAQDKDADDLIREARKIEEYILGCAALPEFTDEKDLTDLMKEMATYSLSEKKNNAHVDEKHCPGCTSASGR